MMNRIKELREEFGFTQQDLADKLSEIFACSIDYLLGKSDVRQIGTKTSSWSLEDIGFDLNNYVPPTDAQKEQIKNLIEIILKENKKNS